MNRWNTKMGITNQEEKVDEELRAFGCYEDGLDYNYKSQLLMALKNSQKTLKQGEPIIVECPTPICTGFDTSFSHELSAESASNLSESNASKCENSLRKSPILKSYRSPKLVPNEQSVCNVLGKSLVTSVGGVHNDENIISTKVGSVNKLKDPLKSYAKPPDMPSEEFSVLLNEHLDQVEYQLWTHYCDQNPNHLHTIESGNVRDKNNLGYNCWDEIMAEVVKERTLKSEPSVKSPLGHCDEVKTDHGDENDTSCNLSGVRRRPRNAFALASKRICCFYENGNIEAEPPGGTCVSDSLVLEKKTDLFDEMKTNVVRKRKMNLLKVYTAKKVSKKVVIDLHEPSLDILSSGKCWSF